MPFAKSPITTQLNHAFMNVTRRKFLKRTIGTAAACGLVRFTAANNESSTDPITDTHVYLGHWPHQKLPNGDPAALVADLRHTGITQAWAGNFDGLFHKDIAGVNQRLADTCTQIGDGMLVPFGTINPTLPDWEEDIRRCHEVFRMPGIRIHPNYHGYTLADRRFARLLELAAARGLIVQLVAWMESDRHLLLNPHEPEIDVKPLAEKIAPLPRLRIIVTNCSRSFEGDSPPALLKNQQVYFDFARANADATKLIDLTSHDRVVFGSCSPLHRVEESVSQLNGMNVSHEVRRKVGSANAAALLASLRKTSATAPGNPRNATLSTL
jgi:predicted TIM-barrel fold metal-dependent hydrolase